MRETQIELSTLIIAAKLKEHSVKFEKMDRDRLIMLARIVDLKNKWIKAKDIHKILLCEHYNIGLGPQTVSNFCRVLPRKFKTKWRGYRQ